MKLKWGLYAPCINEKELIEAKIKWALNHDMAVSICEGHYVNYTKFNQDNHLSVDGTTEILESYSDRINHIKKGFVQAEMELRDAAYKGLPQDIDVCIMSDIDEFLLDKDLEYIDELYAVDKNLKETSTNSYIFLDNKYCTPHLMPSDQGFVNFNKNQGLIQLGQWHERIFRYNKYYSYKWSPFLINDLYGRFIFTDVAYFDERLILPNVYILHYKNFKLKEAKERQAMYTTFDNKDYNLEWDILEKNKIEYKGEHPIEIKELLKDVG